MFIKVQGGRYIRLEKIEMLYIHPTTPHEYWLELVMNGTSYRLQSYSTFENAEYAVDFVMWLFENIDDDQRIVMDLPTEQDVEFYRRVDEDMEDENG